MPKAMKVREIVRLLESDGWFHVATRCSHMQYKHEKKSGRVTVSGKPSDELAPGTLNSILKQAGHQRMTMRYAIVIENAGSNYSAYAPDLPGCVATGETVESVKKQMKEAIRFHLDGLAEDGLPIPQPSRSVEYIAA